MRFVEQFARTGAAESAIAPDVLLGVRSRARGDLRSACSRSRLPGVCRVLAPNCTAPVCTAAQSTRTGAEGHYSFDELPEGRVVVTANTATHAQICGTTSVLRATTELDVEITSRISRLQPSLTMPPLRVRGQLFQLTPAGREGVSRGEIALDLSLDASAQTTSTAFFLEVDADVNGNYRVRASRELAHPFHQRIRGLSSVASVQCRRNARHRATATVGKPSGRVVAARQLPSHSGCRGFENPEQSGLARSRRRHTFRCSVQ